MRPLVSVQAGVAAGGMGVGVALAVGMGGGGVGGSGVTLAVNVGEGVMLVARLGGYLARKHDGPPGAEVLWRGSRKLSNWCECAAFAWPLD